MNTKNINHCCHEELISRTLVGMKASQPKLSVFDYNDYRIFLNAWFIEAKKSRAFSHRLFAQQAGFSSSNFLMLVMQGKRNLTEDSLKKCVVGLKLNKQEQEFFRNLVFFNQSQNHDDKNFYYQRLLQSKKFSELKPIEKIQYEYYSTWYHPVVRELVTAKDFNGTPEWIVARLNPTITAAQAAKSIALLEELKFIKKTGEGRWEQTSSIVSTGPQLTSVTVHNYHKVLLNLSHQVMDTLSMQNRDVSSLTLGVTKQRIAEIRNKIREFRQDILKMAADDSPEDVVLLNVQFFPVTKAVG